MSKPSMNFGEIAVKNGLLTENQFEELKLLQEQTLLQGKSPLTISELAIEKEYMTEREMKAVRKALERYKKDYAKELKLEIPGYEIIDKIGEGGLGTVYKGRQISMNRQVAIKVLHKDWMEDEEFRKRFLLEARIVGKLSHQNLIQVYDVGRAEGRYYFTMEYVNGQPVDEMIDEQGPLKISYSADLTIQVLRVIQYIKGYNLVHRDIKPSNMMVNNDNVLKLGDFGFVRSRPDIDKKLSMDGMVLGTPDYIAPEQALGKDVDFRADLYSLGASFYHMVTGRPPFEGSASTVMEKHIKAAIPPPQEINPSTPENACIVIEKLMAKNPEDRYKSIKSLFHDLDKIKMGGRIKASRLAAGKSVVYRPGRINSIKSSSIKINKLEKKIEKLENLLKILLISLVVSIIFVILLLFIVISKNLQT